MVVVVVSPSASGGGAAAGKRKWTEVDWEISMEAMSYVAVFADPVPEGDDEAGDDEQDAKKKKKLAASKAKGSANTKKAAAGGKETAPTTTVKGKPKATGKKAKTMSKPTARTTRANSKKDEDGEDDEEEDEGTDKKPAEAKVTAAATGDAATPQPVEEFWIARLLGDVTQDMLEDEDASVHVTWLNKVTAQAKKDRYVNAFDDTIAVQAILCHVYLVEFDDESMEITPKSLKRVRSLSCLDASVCL